MNYKQYLKQPINESLNSAKAKFSGSPEEFEVLKDLDPTANKKWKYMDFIVKTGNQSDLKDLLSEFERLCNKGIIKNKDINSYDYESLKQEINKSSKVTTKRQSKIDVKKDVIKVNDNPLVVVPLTKKKQVFNMAKELDGVQQL